MVPDVSRVRQGTVPGGAPRVAVGVSYNRGRDQWHAALVYGTELLPPRCLHLASDRDLRDVNLDDEDLGWPLRYAWVELRLPGETARAIAQLCRQAARRVRSRGQEVRYGIRHHLGRFDAETGAYLPAAGERGLTCATCVLALCRGAQVELVDIAAWPAREEDGPWIKRVVDSLRRSDPTHAAAVESDGLCARFRPTEVAAAGLADRLPIDFPTAVRLSDALRERYDALFPVTDL